MTEEELITTFKENDEEYLKFDRIKHKRSQRRDLHAFLLLDQLVPRTRNIVCGATHDEIFLDILLDDLAKTTITTDEAIELIRCGVRLDAYKEGLAMFA